ncbi:MAG: 30S ribosomal protein S27ae [Candidatus Altiarchaeota archaeon]
MSKKWKLYNVKDKLERLNKSCPKCGPGVFMAKHKDRLSCGKCGYSEFMKSQEGTAKAEKKKSGT